MGRGQWYRWDKKSTVDDKLALSAHDTLTGIADPTGRGVYSLTWKRGDNQIASLHLMTDPDRAGVFLSYSHQGQPVTPYLVRWDVTTPRFGGRRYWWLCPQCGRRCATIYGGPRFLCRVCQNLTYETAQSGNVRTTLHRRMLAIRRRLGARTGTGWLCDGLPDKPREMHWGTYSRLRREYYNLDDLLTMMLTVDVFDGSGWPADLAEGAAHYRDTLQAAVAAYRRAPDHETDFSPRWETADPAPDLPARPERFTLGELATRAGVPYAFAQEAQREGLLRPDAGRTKRAKRYRSKLAAWLGKLHALHAAGLAWGDLRDWAGRRFTPGHEHERQYPAGYDADTSWKRGNLMEADGLASAGAA